MHIVELVAIYWLLSVSSLVYISQAHDISIVQPASKESQTQISPFVIFEKNFFPVVIPAHAGQQIPTRSDWRKTVTLSLQNFKFCPYRGRSDITQGSV